MSAEDEDLLNVDNSPKTMSRKPRRPGRRLNNKPKLLLVIGVAIVGGLIVAALINRANSRNQQSGNDTPSNASSAMDYARDIVIPNRGVIEAYKPDPKPEPIPEPPKTPDPIVITKLVREPLRMEKPESLPLTPEPPPFVPEPVREDPNIARMRQRRFEMAEQAIASKVSMQTIRNDTASQNGSQMNANQSGIGVPLDGSTKSGMDYSGRSDLSAIGQFSGDSGRWKPVGEVEAPHSRFLLRTGSVIPATLLSGLSSDLPGQIIGQVSQNVYDTATGSYLLIPQGSRLIGEYSSQVQYGQSRVFAVWQRVVFPDGKTLDLGAMPASTGAGYAGLKDKVNNHYLRIFGSALMMSAVIAGIDQTQNGSNSSSDSKDMSDSMSEALGTTFGNLIAEMMRKNMAIAPTIQIRPGFRLNVMLVKDLAFKGPYRAFDYIQR